MMAYDPWFRGIDIKCGPDGNVFVSDWTDLGECHDNDGTHRSSGRIYKISYGKSEASMSEAPNLAALSNFELLELIDHKNSWYWSHALRILHERSESGSDMGALSAELRRQWQAHASSPTTRKLRLLSAQKLTKTMTTADLHFLLDDTNEQVQSWAIRELAERNLTNNIESARRLHSVSKDASPIVQLAIASSIHHTDPSRPIYHQIVASLMRKMPSDDQNLPMMIWSAAERMAETNTEFVELLQIAANNEAVHDIRTYIARRFIVDHANDSVRLEQLTDHASRLAQSNKQAAVAVLRGMMQGLRAQRKLKRPSNWDQVAKNINSPIAEELSLKFGDKSVISRLRSNASDTSLNPRVRRSAIRMLSDNLIVGTRDLLIKLINDRAIRRFAIESLDNFNSSDVSQALVDNFDTFRPAEQRAAIATLTSSRQHAAVLLTAIAKEQIAANAIKPANAMTIYQLKDSGLRRQLKELWGDIRSTPRELKQNIADWKAVLSPEVLALADLAKGQKLYMENCGKCHRLFGEGVAIGPDLTGSDRKNLDYVLENVVTPSAVVGKDYRTSTIRLNDGRSISGSLRQQTRQTVVVQTIDGQITLNRDDIEAIDASNLSLMPEGQFDVLTKDQVRDLIGYLRSN